MTPTPSPEALALTDEVLRELHGRRGYRQVNDTIEEDIQEEIRESIAFIIDAAFSEKLHDEFNRGKMEAADILEKRKHPITTKETHGLCMYCLDVDNHQAAILASIDEKGK